ncbi:MAG: UDP-N-acetylmuramoyl-tripeptide--D-alanyl-D-alanine ligase [Deltaproteobacteria bacterium]|nr:UDP-N-acetylmuramoyl-tripeptide--D-alanyl-D-alanine ligase [Deltaproteobacteria bacterium]
MELTIDEILKATGGTLPTGNLKTIVRSIGTDTRKLKAGDFYAALVGPRFDGHNFVADALAKGASGVLVSRTVGAHSHEVVPPRGCAPLPVVQVPDTQRALGDIAKYWRSRWQRHWRFDIPVVAITGSCGKTTTKDLLSALLSQKGDVLKTEGNLNNLIGLPLTVFGLSKEHRFAVLEMGMNAFGEIARLTEIACPTIGLITNVGHAHLEGVGDIEGVARAKGELFEGLGPSAVAVVNADDPRIAKLPTKARKLTFGRKAKADIQATHVEYDAGKMRVTVRDPSGQRTVFTLPMAGEHHVLNWLAAYAVGFELGVDPRQAQTALDTFKPGAMRGEEIRLKNDIIVVNDAYNANPDSMAAALAVLAKCYPRRRRVAVLGEMWELGDETAALHRWVGKTAGESKIDLLFAYGEHAPDMVQGFPSGGFAFADMPELCRKLKESLRKEDVVLVKGSRGSQMERVVEFLERELS